MRELRSLNLDDLDVGELERRLELSMAVSDTALYCGTDCPTSCPQLQTCCGEHVENPT